MSKFDTPIFSKPSDPKGDVIIFDKSPELQLEDVKKGASRFGGTWRKPSYLLAYLRSAAVLIEHGERSGTLDDYGLPTFYLQRHTLELLIKRLLYWLYELADMLQELGKSATGVPSKQQRRDFKRSHNIKLLYQDLSKTALHFGFTEPPAELGEIVTKIAKFEMTETWSRYERSEDKEGIHLHVEQEVALPLVEIQRQLESVVERCSYRLASDPAYENELYEKWLYTARATGKAG